MPCWAKECLQKKLRISIPSQVHQEIDNALNRVEKLLAFPVQWEQERKLGEKLWTTFSQKFPLAAMLLTKRWQKNKFAENVLALFLDGRPSLRIFEWLSGLSESNWNEFMELMRVNPTVLKWLSFHSQGGQFYVKNAYQEKHWRHHRLIAIQQQQKIRIR